MWSEIISPIHLQHQHRKDGWLDQKELDRLAKEWANTLDLPTSIEQIIQPIEKDWGKSMFSIQDFALKSMKTFKNRPGRKIVVWDAQQSVEMIPNDVITKVLQSNGSGSWSGTIKYCVASGNQFDFTVNTWSPYTIQSSRKQPLILNKLEIVTPWIYEIEFAYWVTSMNNVQAIRFAVEKWWVAIVQDRQERPQVQITDAPTFGFPITTISWYRRQKVKLVKWDTLEFIVSVLYSWSGSFTLDKNYTSRTLHYFSSNR